MVVGKFLHRLNSKHDLLFLNVVAPIMWVLLASVAYLAFAKGNIGEGIGHIGLLIVAFWGMIGPLWGIVDPARDPVLYKAGTITTLFGLLILAAGWLIRFTT